MAGNVSEGKKSMRHLCDFDFGLPLPQKRSRDNNWAYYSAADGWGM